MAPPASEASLPVGIGVKKRMKGEQMVGLGVAVAGSLTGFLGFVGLMVATWPNASWSY